MKDNESKKSMDDAFHVGKCVYVTFHPYRQRSIAYQSYENLASKVYGLSKVLQHLEKVTYRLELPVSSKILQVLNTSQLRGAIGSSPESTTISAQLTLGPKLVAMPELVVNVHKVQHRSQWTLEVLINWHGSPPFEATWEVTGDLNARFQHFHLEDKVNL